MKRTAIGNSKKKVSNKKSDLNGFIIKIAKIVALVPWDTKNGHWKSIFYCVLIASLIFVGAVASFIGRVLLNYGTNNITSVVLDIACNIVLAFLNVYSIVKIGIFNQAELKKIRRTIGQIDTSTKRYLDDTDVNKSSRRFTIAMIVIHGYYLTILVFNTHYFMIRLGFSVGKFFMFRGIQQYYMVILVLMLYDLAVNLTYSFTRLHKTITKICLKFKCATITSTITTDLKLAVFQNEIRTVCSMYGLLLDNMLQFSEIFGVTMVAIPVRTVLEALLPLNLILLFYFHVGKSWIVVIWGTLWLILSCVLVILLAVSCNRATKEARRTISIAYRLINDINSVNNSARTKNVCDDLFLLAQITHVYSPQISAAGFFSVDYTMLFTLVAGVTSYFIVLIQIIK